MKNTNAALEHAIAELTTQVPSCQLSDSLLLGFDTETTGVQPGKDAIVSASLVLRDPKRGYEDDIIGEWIINPHRPISSVAGRINGFTDAFLVENGAEPQEAIKKIAQVISNAQDKNIPLLAYNAPFDISMLNGDIERWCPSEYALNVPEMLVVDPLVIDRAISHRSGRRSLEYTTEYYGVVAHGDFHNATADTVAALDLIKPITTLYPQVAHIKMDELMSWQRQAHEQWANSYQQWAKEHNRRSIFNTKWL
jgi:DNA polymerase III subunit epsilon